LTPGVNNIELELILGRAFPKRFAGYLHCGQLFTKFSVDEYVQTLKVGLEFALDYKEK